MWPKGGNGLCPDVMNEYLIFQDEKSQKFWSVVTHENSMTVAYGRLGTKGQETQKQFDSPEKCEKEATKLMNSKIKSGYTVTTKEGMENTKEESRRFGYTYDQWDEGKTQEDLCNSILNYKGFADLKQIVIANWNQPYEESCQATIDFIIQNKDKFSHIESFVFGDMDSEECEISWIIQADYSEIWSLPKLKRICIQGSTDLTLGNIVSDSLRELEIRCGGLPLSILHSVEAAKAPNLEFLNLYMGVEDYGFDCTTEDIAKFLQNSQFPNLKYLGLCNSEIPLDIIKAVLDSKYVAQITTLDLSMSVFYDESAQLILDNITKLPSLKLLNLEYHFLSSDMMKKLTNLPFEVNVKDPQESDGDEDDARCYDSPMFTE